MISKCTKTKQILQLSLKKKAFSKHALSNISKLKEPVVYCREPDCTLQMDIDMNKHTK